MSIKQYDSEIAEINAEISLYFELSNEMSKRYQDAINAREKLIISQIPC